MFLETLLIVLIIIVLSYPRVLYTMSRRGKMITVKSKDLKKRRISDENGHVYKLAHLQWLMKNELNRDFENMNVGHTYKINLFGMNEPRINSYEYIYEYEEI